MKVKVKDVKANPYRNINHYPLNKEKIMALTRSIEKTGFWDNLVGRKINGEIQMAYGHHRVEALRLAKGYGYDFEFELPIRDISDAMMIQIMANENMSEWGHDIKVIDETVKVTKEFLESDSKFLAAKNIQAKYNKKEVSAEDIASFLGWSKGGVHSSLLRINAIESGEVSKKAIETFTGTQKSQRFISEVKKHNFTPEEQEQIAKDIVKNEVPRADIQSVIKKKAHDRDYKKNKDKKTDPRIKKFDHELLHISYEIGQLSDKFSKLKSLTKEIKNISSKKGVDNLEIFFASIGKLQRKINKFLEIIGENNELTEDYTNEIKQLKK